MPAGASVEPPHSMKLTEECALDEVVNLVSLHSSIMSAAIWGKFTL